MIETDTKLVDLDDRSRRNNLRLEEIKEYENELNWEENKNRSRPIVAQFSFYKDKMNILKNCKK